MRGIMARMRSHPDFEPTRPSWWKEWESQVRVFLSLFGVPYAPNPNAHSFMHVHGPFVLSLYLLTSSLVATQAHSRVNTLATSAPHSIPSRAPPGEKAHLSGYQTGQPAHPIRPCQVKRCPSLALNPTEIRTRSPNRALNPNPSLTTSPLTPTTPN